ncbi:MAG TPA: polyphenol oxidase family protein [Candidatus Bathyarchaeia archaeon]|nr:polyphenol oxidase family protein [Candidatus Bathyarchaeia archaeon]
MEWVTQNGITIGRFPPLAVIAPGLEVFITTRGGGVSPPPFASLNLGGDLGDRTLNIRSNRALLLASLGISSRSVARTGQIHGSEIALVTRAGCYPGFDGFVTTRKGLTLAISTADCYSVVVYSPPERALAALHVGRRGAERGIVGRAVDIMRAEHRIDPSYAIAVIGPGICGACYTVSRKDALRFPKEVRRFERGAWHLDLGAFILRELTHAGLRRRNVFSSGLCTACNPALFFSHRRDHGITGRHWTLATVGAAGPCSERLR